MIGIGCMIIAVLDETHRVEMQPWVRANGSLEWDIYLSRAVVPNTESDSIHSYEEELGGGEWIGSLESIQGELREELIRLGASEALVNSVMTFAKGLYVAISSICPSVNKE